MARTASLTEVLQNSKAWESTLVKIPGVTLTGNSVFDGVLTVSSDNASIDMFTRFSANFANNPVPEGEVELTAIVSSFNEVAQLVMRNGTDVTGGTPGDGGGDGGGDPGGSTELDTVSMISEMFNSVGVDEDFASSGWTNTALQGTRLWRGKIFDDNLYVQATSFADNDPNMEAWLVTPGINLEEASSLSFESAKAFYDHDGLSVFVSSDYDGDVGAATWEPINARIATASDPDHDWIGSGNIDLDVYEGIIHIGFRYIGDNSNNDTSYRIDNIVVQ